MKATSNNHSLEKREASEDEEMTESDLIEDEGLEGMTTDLAKLLQLQCRQLVRIEAELQKQREILEKHTKYLSTIKSSAAFVALLIAIGLVLSMCSGFLGTY